MTESEWLSAAQILGLGDWWLQMLFRRSVILMEVKVVNINMYVFYAYNKVEGQEDVKEC